MSAARLYDRASEALEALEDERAELAEERDQLRTALDEANATIEQLRADLADSALAFAGAMKAAGAVS